MNDLSKFINMRKNMSDNNAVDTGQPPMGSTQAAAPPPAVSFLDDDDVFTDDIDVQQYVQQTQQMQHTHEGAQQTERQTERQMQDDVDADDLLEHGIFDDLPEPLTPDPEALDPLTAEPTVFLPNTEEHEEPKMTRLRAGVDTAAAGFDSTIWFWEHGDVPEEGRELLDEVKEKTHALFAALLDDKGEGHEILRAMVERHRKEKRMVIVSFGMILMCLHEAGLMKTEHEAESAGPLEMFADVQQQQQQQRRKKKKGGMRPWQRLLVLQIAKYYADVALGIITQYDESRTFPQFLPSPLFSLPTGSGKSFAGIITSLCSAIRINGEDIKLIHPHNAKAIWCTPTRITAFDVGRKMQAIARTETFRQLMPGNFGADMDRLVVTIGAGEEAPRIKEKMFCVMTYEYARTQLISAVIDDKGDPRARRQPLIAALRCVIVDEAHILVKNAERSRSFVADNILVACAAMRVPTVMLTATGSEQFRHFVAQYFPSDYAFGDDAHREHPIYTSALAVPNSSATDRDGNLTAVDKRILFRCVTETFFKPTERQPHGGVQFAEAGMLSPTDDEEPTRSIVFIQSVKGVELAAAYAAGLFIALTCRGDASTVAGYLVQRAAEYIGTDRSQWEEAFVPKDVSTADLLKSLLAGAEDIAGPLGADLLRDVSFKQASAMRVFVIMLAMSCDIVPIFANFAKAGVPQTRLDNMVLGDEVTYRVVIATSLIIEGVNIAGADNVYVTPQGYKCLTNTQYTQLCGRVGRTKPGYVESWVPVRPQIDGTIVPVKNESVVRAERHGETDRLAETDDLIDRVLFLKKLGSMLRCHVADYDELAVNGVDNRGWARRGVDPWETAVRMLAENTLRNNYFRGLIRPRITSFFTPAAVSEELFAAEACGQYIPLDVYEGFVEMFSPPQYMIFFAVFRDASFNAASPRLTLDTISFFLELGGQSFSTPYCGLTLLPAVLLIPVFMQYSYAFDPKFNWADYKKLRTEDLDALHAIGYEVEKVSGVTAAVAFLGKVVSRVLPGVMLNPSDMKNVEQASLAFAESLLVDPLIWKRVTGENFVNILQFMLSYLRTAEKIINCREGSTTVDPRTDEEVVEWAPFPVDEEGATRVWTLLEIIRQLIASMRETIERSDAKSSAYAMGGIADPLREQRVKFSVPGGGVGFRRVEMQLPINYHDYINGCLGDDAQSIAQKARLDRTSESAIFDRHKKFFYGSF